MCVLPSLKIKTNLFLFKPVDIIALHCIVELFILSVYFVRACTFHMSQFYVCIQNIVQRQKRPFESQLRVFLLMIHWKLNVLQIRKFKQKILVFLTMQSEMRFEIDVNKE